MHVYRPIEEALWYDTEAIMHQLHPNTLFDLSAFAHATLFEGHNYVWEALGAIRSYLERYPLGEIIPSVPDSVHLINREQISIGEGSIVEPGAYIKGPCVIGRNCTIRHGAYLRGDVIIGDECVVGHDTEVKHSILLNGAKAAHFAYLGDSILGNDCNLGAGTKCANLRLDDDVVVIRWGGESVNTGRRKLGAILGDATQTGCNAVTNPGTITGKGVVCYPCLQFGGVIPEGCVVKQSGGAVVVKKRLERNPASK